MAENGELWILEGEGDIEEDPEEDPEQESDDEENEWNVVVADDDDEEDEEGPIEIADEGLMKGRLKKKFGWLSVP
ncbi:hypothetical protein ACET3Z_001753 [Daucus carota]